jgi:hypothetical protein
MKRWVFLFLFLPFLLRANPDSGSILLYNNSPFILTATIQASDGTYLGESTIQPNQQKNFTTNLSPTQYQHPGRPDVSLTPYTVIWQCPSEGYYSVCTNVSPGSLVRSNDCPGSYFCDPKKQKEKKPASEIKKLK